MLRVCVPYATMDGQMVRAVGGVLAWAGQWLAERESPEKWRE